MSIVTNDPLAGVRPVTQGANPAPAPTGVAPTVTLPEGFTQPTSAVYADPNERVNLNPDVVATVVPPAQPTAPTETPAESPAPVVPTAVAADAPTIITALDPNWRFSDEIKGGDVILNEVNRICAGKQVDPHNLIIALRDGTMDETAVKQLKTHFGESGDFVFGAVNTMLDKHFEIEATAIHQAVGGKPAWDVLSAWAGKADIAPAERKAINQTLAKGGFAAKAVATQLMTAFNTHASLEDKQKMISILNTGAPAPVAAVAPTAAAPTTVPNALLSGDGAAPVAANFEPIHNARELAELSRKAVADGKYTPQFEDQLAARLKQSMAAGVYKRTSLPTPPPANIMVALRNRV